MSNRFTGPGELSIQSLDDVRVKIIPKVFLIYIYKKKKCVELDKAV